MDDDLFRNAFGRLSDSLDAPGDASARVAARTSDLRRRRRVLTGTATASVAFLAIGGAAAATSLGSGGGNGTTPLAPAASSTVPVTAPEPTDDERCTVVADADGARPVVEDEQGAVDLLVRRFGGDRPDVAVGDGHDASGTLELRLGSEGDRQIVEMELRRTDDGLELVEVRSCAP